MQRCTCTSRDEEERRPLVDSISALGIAPVAHVLFCQHTAKLFISSTVHLKLSTNRNKPAVPRIDNTVPVIPLFFPLLRGLHCLRPATICAAAAGSRRANSGHELLPVRQSFQATRGAWTSSRSFPFGSNTVKVGATNVGAGGARGYTVDGWPSGSPWYTQTVYDRLHLGTVSVRRRIFLTDSECGTFILGRYATLADTRPLERATF